MSDILTPSGESPLDPNSAKQAPPHEAFLYAQAVILDAFNAISYLVRHQVVVGFTVHLACDPRLKGVAAAIPIPCGDFIHLVTPEATEEEPEPEAEHGIAMRFFGPLHFEVIRQAGEWAHEQLMQLHATTNACAEYLQVRENAQKMREMGKSRIIAPSRS